MGRLLVLLLSAAASTCAAQGQRAEMPTAPNSTDIRDIRAALPVAVTPPFALTGGLLLLVGGLFLIRRKLRRHAAVTPPPPGETGPAPGDLLARLGSDYRQGNIPGEQLIVRLDALIRSALAARTGVPAQRLTSAEFQQRAAPFLNDMEKTLLGGLLPLGDRVKFAGYRPEPAALDWALGAAGRLLEGAPAESVP